MHDRPPDVRGRAGRETRHPIWRSPFFWAALAGMVVIPLSRPLLRFEPPPPPVGPRLPEVLLLDQDGSPFAIPSTSGQVLVLSFFFTRCTTSCPRLVAGLSSLVRRYAEAGIDGVTVASITVNPRDDGTQELRAWAREHGLETGRFRLLTGDPQAIHTLAGALGLALGTPVTLPGEPSGRIDVAHSDRLVLVDASGHVRGLYRSDERGRDETFYRSQHLLREARRPGASAMTGPSRREAQPRDPSTENPRQQSVAASLPAPHRDPSRTEKRRADLRGEAHGSSPARRRRAASLIASPP